MIVQPIRTLESIPDQKVLDALLDLWAWRVWSQYLDVPCSVQGVRETLQIRRVEGVWEVAVAGLDVDPLTLGALSDSLAAFSQGFMVGVCYQQGL